MPTAREMIERTGLELGIIGVGQPFDTAEENDLLARLHQLLDSFTLKGWVWPAQGYQSVSFFRSDAHTSGRRFTLGPSGRDIAVSRVPLRITAVQDPSNRPLIQTDLLSVLKEGAKDDVTHFFYELVSDNSNTLNYGTAQYGRIHFNRDLEARPDLTYDIFYQQPLMTGGRLDASDQLLLPYGFERFVMFQFAKELLNPYGIMGEIAQRVYLTSQELMNDVMELNKDLYAGHMRSMLKTSVPGTDAGVEANSPVAGPPLGRQAQ